VTLAVTPSRSFKSVLALAALLAAVACGANESPTEPLTGGPRITGVTPSTPIQSDTPQLLSIRGDLFLTGMSLVVNGPDNSTTIYGNSDIEGLQQTSFQVRVLLARVGPYTLTPRSPTGTLSHGFQIQVLSDGAGPAISSLTPPALSRSTLGQSVAAQGTNFAPGLTVTIIEPDGATATIGGGNVTVSSSTVFQIFYVFSKVGTYTLRATNPDGASTNTVSLLVGQ
jgi:hypothetical protein